MPGLRMEGIRKHYLTSGVDANAGVVLEVADREIHALVGENGAGKTTLMKILYGLERPDAGRIFLDGRPVSIPDPAAAVALGIGMVPQHAEVVGEFSVAENVCLCAEPRRLGFILDGRRARAEVARLAARHGFGLDPAAPASSLSAAELQELEILKLLWRGARLLILDEPTSLLAEHEVAGLFAGLRRLRDAGKTIILITHKAEEVRLIADSVTVMRAGRTFIRLSAAGLAGADLGSLMMGSTVAGPAVPGPGRGKAAAASASPRMAGQPAFELREVSLLRRHSAPPSIDRLSLAVRGGEVLAVCGLAGNGLAELEDLAAGLRKPSRGAVLLGGAPLPRLRGGGQGYVPTDRLWRGASLYSSVSENLVALDRKAFFPHGLDDRGAMDRFAGSSIGCLGIAAGPTQRLGTLSGGNIQKVILARELAVARAARDAAGPAADAGSCPEDRPPPFLLFCNPTQGLDIASAAFVHERVSEERDKGAAILLLSSNLDEVLGLADRVLVMHRGRAVLEAQNDAGLDRAAIADAMLGIGLAEEAPR